MSAITINAYKVIAQSKLKPIPKPQLNLGNPQVGKPAPPASQTAYATGSLALLTIRQCS